MTNVKTSFLVGTADEGKRLDVFVQASAPDLSRSRAASLIRAGSITIAGRLAKPSSLMQLGDSVSITVSDVEQSGLIPQSIPIGVVYEDGQFIVIDKPAGLTVHPAPGHPDGTLVNALLALVPDLPGVGGVQRPGIVHRLDKDTSGLIVVAKTDAAHRSLSRQLKERTVRKTYIALLDGQVQGNEWSVDAPIARNPKNRKKMAVVESGRAALSEFRVVERFDGLHGRFTLVEVHPVTGRTHQIRVHSAHIRHPLVGDSVYGKRSSLVARHFLHASRIEFALPPRELGRKEFESSLPDDLDRILTVLRTDS